VFKQYCGDTTTEQQQQQQQRTTFYSLDSIVAQSLLNQHTTESSTHCNERFTASNTVGFKRRATWYKDLDDEPRRAHTTS
jgi:hypothetical protein